MYLAGFLTLDGNFYGTVESEKYQRFIEDNLLKRLVLSFDRSN